MRWRSRSPSKARPTRARRSTSRPSISSLPSGPPRLPSRPTRLAGCTSKRATRRTRRGGTRPATRCRAGRRTSQAASSICGVSGGCTRRRASPSARSAPRTRMPTALPQRRSSRRRRACRTRGPRSRISTATLRCIPASRRPRSRRLLVPTSRIRSWCCCRRALQRWRATRRALRSSGARCYVQRALAAERVCAPPPRRHNWTGQMSP